MEHNASLLQKERLQFKPVLPSLLRSSFAQIGWQEDSSQKMPCSDSGLKELFPLSINKPLLKAVLQPTSIVTGPLRLGVFFSGGTAPGGHNVIAGIYDALKMLHKDSALIGFLEGPAGLLKGSYIEIDRSRIDRYRNTGGFDLLGSSRTKIESIEDLDASLSELTHLKLNGLIVIGGDDSNTNAAIMAEHFCHRGSSICVIGVPKTIDGDLKNPLQEVSFGFDTACKVYSEIVGNIAKDAVSARKYYHFIRLMGRSASHIVLETALQTQPNLALISEEVASQKQTLQEMVLMIVELIVQRFSEGKCFGVILIPEGIIEAIAEIGALIDEINQLLVKQEIVDGVSIRPFLSPSAQKTLANLPQDIQEQLLSQRDPHGNVHVSGIASEKLLVDLVKEELKKREKTLRKKIPFSPVHHFLGYEARAAFPSFFDSCYTYALGQTACLLVQAKKTGYMACLTQLTKPPAEWGIGAVPLVSLMHLEMRKGQQKPVIAKTLVQMTDPAFYYLKQKRGLWRLEDCYLSPGPMQFFATPALVESVAMTVRLNHS